MSEWNDQALIVRRGVFHESDVWLKMLFREHGLITIFAFGGAKSKRRFCGCLDIFNSLQCRVKSSRNGRFLNLQEASLLGGPRSLRKNWQAMGIAANCLRFVEALSINIENSVECYTIVEDLRNMLERGADPPALLPFYFRLRIAAALGMAPDFSACGKCGKPHASRFFFRVDEGRIFCESCVLKFNTYRYSIQLTPAVLGLLREIPGRLPTDWPVREIASAEGKTGAMAIDGFIQYHLGLAWDNGHFRYV